MKRLGIGAGIFVAILAVIWLMIGSDWRRLILAAPSDANVLFWTQNQRDAGFRMLDRVSFLIDARDIRASDTLKELPEGSPLSLDLDLDAYLQDNRHSAIVVLHDGKIRLESYGLGFKETGRWTSFSVAKSLTSTLVGAAIIDGHIESLADPVSKYIPDLVGSAYDDVTVEQLLTMSSGVRWIEDYDDPSSDVALFNDHVSEDGSSNLVSYMKALPRAHPPGTVWNYSTGETNLIGILVSEATGETLSDYLSEKIWGPYGMEQDATWLLNDDGTEISGCCIQATTRDFARFGQFMLEGAAVDGQSLVPGGWLDRATTKQIGIGVPGQGYGFQWWTYDDGAYAADGIFGQGIFIDPTRNLVIATNSSWSSAMGDVDLSHAKREEFFQAVQAAVDAEG
ncbi:MAG: beta-lactamase family protein [Hyphomonas sp.]|nr:beta-lactamase family protein [Hyphomonas sp.]